MRLEIRKDLRGIYNYLLSEKIDNYLLSKEFKEFCDKNIEIKDIWKESENYSNNMSFLLYSFRGKGELIDISFGIFLEKLLSLGKEKFLEFILNITKDFFNSKNKEVNLTDIHKNFKSLNYTYEEIVECYNKL
ncbi:MAG: hypothetical protein ACP5IV_06195 [Caldisericia bacterium]